MASNQSNIILIGSKNINHVLVAQSFTQKIYEKVIQPKKLVVSLRYVSEGSNLDRLKGVAFVIKVFGPAHNKKNAKVANEVPLPPNATNQLISYYQAAKCGKLADHYIEEYKQLYFPEILSEDIMLKCEENCRDLRTMFSESTSPIILLRHMAVLVTDLLTEDTEYDLLTLGYQPKRIVGNRSEASNKPWVITVDKTRAITIAPVDDGMFDCGTSKTATSIRLSSEDFYDIMRTIDRTAYEWNNNSFMLRKSRMH